MPSEARQKKIMEKLNRAQKCSVLGPQNLGSRGARAPGPPPGSAPASTLFHEGSAFVSTICHDLRLATLFHQEHCNSILVKDNIPVN